MVYDIIIKNGKIISGAGNPWYYGEIGVKEGRITKICSIINEDTNKVIDAQGLIICPGFIDIHSHTDYILPVNRSQESTLCQGITTTMVGMCGDGMAPIPEGKEEEFKKKLAKIDPVLQQFDFPYHTCLLYTSPSPRDRS